jgi:hypothetical protein
VYDRIEPLEIGLGEVAEVFANSRNVGSCIAKITVGIEVGIQADHVVASRAQDGPGYGTDITLMASKQYFHATPISKNRVAGLAEPLDFANRFWSGDFDAYAGKTSASLIRKGQT